ncbi:MAG: protoheme IX farnesyltransferase [Chloroflexi bacterium]|nr:protoheme IX farnesyltransferase [Chloroflexota bacterium]
MRGRVWNYIQVLKPRETSLLVFISLCTAIVAAGDAVSPGRLLFTLATVALGCGGVNGLTNYLDRGVDARMERTRHRVLPSGRIHPPEKALLFTGTVTALSLGMAWYLHPLCFAAGSIGILFAVIKRKTVVCPFFGAAASCAPVAIAWFAFRPEFDLPLLFLCLLICIWVPIHVWSVMIAHREDYVAGGVRYFPLSRENGQAVKVLFLLSLPLCALSIAVYFSSHLGWLYLTVAAILGVLMFYANYRLIISKVSHDAWRVYKLSAFPYLGLIFLAMCLDARLLR